MARTKGSGWGGGTLLYQICPYCGRKKAIYQQITNASSFKCIWCKERFESKILLKKSFKSQVKNEN